MQANPDVKLCARKDILQEFLITKRNRYTRLVTTKYQM